MCSRREPGALRQPASTPYLRMHLDGLERRYARFSSAFPGVDVHFAMKCNNDRSVLSCLHRHGCKFEIASAAELDVLLGLGVRAAQVLFSNPVKTPADIRRAAQAGVWRFACDSSAELHKIASVAPNAAVYLRLAVAAGGSVVASEGKFGIDARTVIGLALKARRLRLDVHGLTFHVGSQMLQPDAWAAAIAECGEIMRQLQRHDIVISMVDIGGGFPARYDADVPPLEVIGGAVTEAIATDLPYTVHVVAEPGRSLVAECGEMVSTVIGIAERGGRRWLHLDVGAFNGLMEYLETSNQLPYPITDSIHSELTVLSQLTGPSCDSQDTILFDVALSAELAVGDQVVIGSAGAYTTAYASHFNGCDIPYVVAVTSNNKITASARRGPQTSLPPRRDEQFTAPSVNSKAALRCAPPDLPSRP